MREGGEGERESGREMTKRDRDINWLRRERQGEKERETKRDREWQKEAERDTERETVRVTKKDRER